MSGHCPPKSLGQSPEAGASASSSLACASGTREPGQGPPSAPHLPSPPRPAEGPRPPGHPRDIPKNIVGRTLSGQTVAPLGSAEQSHREATCSKRSSAGLTQPLRPGAPSRSPPLGGSRASACTHCRPYTPFQGHPPVGRKAGSPRRGPASTSWRSGVLAWAACSPAPPPKGSQQLPGLPGPSEQTHPQVRAASRVCASHRKKPPTQLV